MLLFFGFFFLVIQNYALSKIPHFIKEALDEVRADNEWQLLIGYLTWALFFTFVTCGAMFLMRKYIISVSRYVEYELRDVLFKKLMRIDYRFYLENQTGDLISRCTNDLNDVRTLLGPGIMYIPNSITRVIFFSPILFAISPRLMMSVFSMLLGLIIFIIVIMPRLRPLYRRIQEKIGEVNNRAWQIISGIYTLKLYHRESIEKKRFEELNKTYIDVQMKLVKWRGFLWPFFLYIVALTHFLILFIGGKEVIAGKMTLGELLQFTIMISSLQFPILSFGWVMSLLQQGISAMSRLRTIYERFDEPTGDTIVSEKKGITYHLNNLNFIYYGQKEPALSVTDLTIHHGEFLGITGPIGSGKSTLVNLLTGILRPRDGELFVNDVDLNKVNIHELRKNIALVPQDSFLFSRTITDNIALGKKNIREEHLRYSTEISKLTLDINEMQNGFHQMVGERGITLSGGQKQRTAIARAIYKDKNFIILDDSLCSLDSIIEDSIIKNLINIKKDKTIIMISNRVSALKHTDRILIIKDNSLIEQGSHQELLKKKEGYYHTLFELQKMEKGLT